jgi:hypothetical protein
MSLRALGCLGLNIGGDRVRAKRGNEGSDVIDAVNDAGIMLQLDSLLPSSINERTRLDLANSSSAYFELRGIH